MGTLPQEPAAAAGEKPDLLRDLGAYLTLDRAQRHFGFGERRGGEGGRCSAALVLRLGLGVGAAAAKRNGILRVAGVATHRSSSQQCGGGGHMGEAAKSACLPLPPADAASVGLSDAQAAEIAVMFSKFDTGAAHFCFASGNAVPMRAQLAAVWRCSNRDGALPRRASKGTTQQPCAPVHK